MAEVMERTAAISPCGRYRYSLTRHWNPSKPSVLFIMLNPSTADAENDDPTIRRCIGFAKRWGAGGLRVCNLYAWRATKPADLKAVPPRDVIAEPPGFSILDRNDLAIISASADASRIIAAWGAWAGPLANRTMWVSNLLTNRHVEALALTQHGAPRHPLYVRGDVEPVTFWGTPPTSGGQR